MSKPVSEIDETGRPKEGAKLKKTVEMTFEKVLDQVISGIKCGTPISKTLKRIGFNRWIFYNNLSETDKIYLGQLKRLRTKGVMSSGYRVYDTADYNIIE